MRNLGAAMALVTLLAACGRGGQQGNMVNAATPVAAANEALPPPAAETNVMAAQRPDLALPALTPGAEHGPKGARNVLLSFARAIEMGEYGQAWELLSASDKQRWSRSAFAAMFADLQQRSVAVPDGSMEGAAGSSYYTAPITVTGTDRDGRPVRLEGEAILRRVNDVDGASAAQLRWHFERLTLDSTH